MVDEEYYVGSPDNTALDIKIQSGEFSGRGSFEVDVADFRVFANELFRLYSDLNGKAILQDTGYGSSLAFRAVDRTGHIQISGDVYGDATLHSVKFEFVIDQTELRSFCKNLYEDFGALKKHGKQSVCAPCSRREYQKEEMAIRAEIKARRAKKNP